MSIPVIEKTTSNVDQFNQLYHGYDWGDEQPQADIFVKLLDTIDNKEKLPSIIELGSSGTDSSIYSILFEKKFNYNCIIVNTEPRKWLLDDVKTQWKDLHLINAKLYHGYSGEMKCYGCNTIDVSDVPKLSIKKLFTESNIEKLDIFHIDIQGSELSVLEETKADGLLDDVRYFFISTHFGEGKTTYYECLDFLNNHLSCEYHFSDPYRGGMGDGLIVAENLNYKVK